MCTNELKSTKAITLIALVITIVVLLILAGISLSLIMGEGGILNRATDAAKTYSIASAQEKIELLVAEASYDYLQKKYVNDESIDPNTYILNQLSSKVGSFEGCILAIENNVLTLSKDGKTVTGIVGTDGAILWINGTGIPVGIAISDSTHYGDYFDLGTEILGTKTNGVYSSSNTLADGNHPLADWRIFGTDNEGVWLILSDYYPATATSANSSFITSTIGLSLASDTSTYPYAIRSESNRDDLITRLNGTNSAYTGENAEPWKRLLPSSLQNNSNITAVGALTVPQWQKSWNEYYESYLTKQITVTDNGSGAYNTLNMSSNIGYTEGNTLYFPHKSAVSECYGYWLASPYASDTYRVMHVGYSGYVYYSGSSSDGYGVRPAVHLASSINIEQNSTTHVWTISD